MEWVLIFVIQTSLGMASLSGTGCDLFLTYRACAYLANEFNGTTTSIPHAQQRVALCRSICAGRAKGVEAVKASG
jgi:hypothetical protein